MKKGILFFLIGLINFSVFSQEILCNVQVNSSQIQTSDKKIYQTMQTSIYEFLNNTQWTNTVVKNEERIECTMLISIQERVSNDEFKATIQIQSTRPIFGTSYKSTMFNYIDKNFRFKYLEYQSLEFSETTHLSSITSVLAFYVNIILGLDYDSFSDQGGMEYFVKAQNIVNNCQNTAESGWRAFESDKNRYWIAHDFLESRYGTIHDVLYRYHRLGLDKLGEEPDDARFEITESLEELRKIYRENPNAFLLKLFFDSKSTEITNIYSEAYPNEQARIIKTLVEIDPSNSSLYQAITENSEGR
ncbi:MAG: DUF4835 family protein [Flavobacteriales bacterium]|nr:DUF4835 family protein [Flavobacteriales bacterium]MBT5698455.1 DUF4835 family protein [Flavobacteriales bacterium]MBT6698778.1 DUF4835 family protein [Flavobacteriales bacterium]MBT6815863.1 DUF4835 family protein [Flavobacteriales bacterium]MBT7619542.1 DUF4835 family protein [Flavobacteriales bacterium]